MCVYGQTTGNFCLLLSKGIQGAAWKAAQVMESTISDRSHNFTARALHPHKNFTARALHQGNTMTNNWILLQLDLAAAVAIEESPESWLLTWRSTAIYLLHILSCNLSPAYPLLRLDLPCPVQLLMLSCLLLMRDWLWLTACLLASPVSRTNQQLLRIDRQPTQGSICAQPTQLNQLRIDRVWQWLEMDQTWQKPNLRS